MMRYPGQDDTICAIATPMGSGSIGVIRVSGKEALSIAQSVFRGTEPICAFKSHTLHQGEIIDPSNGKTSDEALLVVMREPRSYTGEDVIEIQSHGNPHLLQKILSFLTASGARLATPGEFTRRAFLSGRIDLSQAEAVMELIAAQSDAAQAMALHQLRGTLSREIESIQAALLSLLSRIEASIDFAEQGITLDLQEEMIEQIGAVCQSIHQLVEGYEEGKQIREGSTVVIVGRPNVGKSSVMNRLLGEDRAIVTPIPGTTRDTLSEWLSLQGHLVQLVDTAGIHNTADPIEIEGIRRSKEAINRGALALLVLDASGALTPEEILLVDQIDHTKRLIVLNKKDLPLKIDVVALHARYATDPIIHCSAVTGEGFPELKKELLTRLVPKADTERPLVALLRHKNALQRAEEALQRGLRAAEGSAAAVEFLAADLRDGLSALGEIVGETTTDEILNQIFGQFCIGK
jgi:tRNA modification GTPase